MRMRLPTFDPLMEMVSVNDAYQSPISIGRVSDGEEPDLDFNFPRLTGRTRKTSPIRVGDVLNWQNTRYLVGERMNTPDYNTYWLFQVTRQASWQRMATSKDTLTGLDRNTSTEDMGDIWVAWENVTRQTVDRELNIANEIARVLMAQDVKLNDKIDGQQVKRVLPAYGLKLVEVQ